MSEQTTSDAPTRRSRAKANEPEPADQPTAAEEHTEGELDEDTGLAPAPEAPIDVELFAGDSGTVILPVHVRDADIDPAEVDLRPDVDAERDDTVIEGNQVESLTGAVAANGAAIAINGDVYLFNGQMVAALKQVVDRAVVGLTL